METNQLKFTIQLTEKDYLKFQWAHSGLKRSKKWLVYGLIMLFLYGFVVVSSILLHNFSALSFTLFLPLIIFVGLFAFIYGFTVYKSRSAFKSDSFINQPYELIINEEGLSMNAYRSTLNPAWNDIYRYIVTKDAVYIYIAELKAILIPARYLTEADTAALQELLKNKVNTENYSKQKKKNTSIRIIYYVIIIGVVLVLVFKDCGAERRFTEARRLYKHKEFAAAKVIYSELIANDPQDMNNYLERSKCEVSLSEFDLAIKDCETAIRHNPDNGKAYYCYAHVLYAQEKYDEACKAIHTSIDLGYAKDTEGLCE